MGPEIHYQSEQLWQAQCYAVNQAARHNRERMPAMPMTCTTHRLSPPVASMAEARLIRDYWDSVLSPELQAEIILSTATEQPCCSASGLARYYMMAAYREAN